MNRSQPHRFRPMPDAIYYYTSPGHVLNNLRAGHIRISSFARCNDPFELAAFNMRKGVHYEERRRFRECIRKWQLRQDNNYGLICFSKTWRSPLMWSHYAQDHTGLCLELTMDREKIRQADHVLLDVQYTPTRIHQDSAPSDLDRVKSVRQLQNLCATKFSRWSYEKEVRLLIDLRDPRIVVRRGMRFMPIGGCMELKRIFMGARSEHYLECIEDALGTRRIPVLPTRPAFSRFEIVLQLNRKYWKSRKSI